MPHDHYKKEDVIASLDPLYPYRSDCLNYKGVSFEGEDYLEILSRYILSKKLFDLMPFECRDEFVLHNRKGKKPDTKSEKGLCRFWYFKEHFDEDDLINSLGKPIEYELNLYGKRVNIDLLSYKEGVIHLIEVKGKIEEGNDVYSSDETLLRSALEIKTYDETLGPRKNKLVEQLYDAELIDTKDVTFQLDVLVPSNDYFKDQNNPDLYPELNKLLRKWEINVHYYSDFKRNY